MWIRLVEKDCPDFEGQLYVSLTEVGATFCIKLFASQCQLIWYMIKLVPKIHERRGQCCLACPLLCYTRQSRRGPVARPSATMDTPTPSSHYSAAVRQQCGQTGSSLVVGAISPLGNQAARHSSSSGPRNPAIRSPSAVPSHPLLSRPLQHLRVRKSERMSARAGQ